MSESNVLVSIIIPHWNGIETLSECLTSLSKTNYKPFEIIVVDNCSTDGSQEWVKVNYPNIILIENSDNYGYAGGCNHGIKATNGELVVFLNNDTIQAPMWLSHLVDFILQNPEIAALQPKVELDDGGFIWSFDIRSLNKLKENSKLINPFTTKCFNKEFIINIK